MFLIARIDSSTGWEADWLVSLSPKADQVEVTRVRRNARRLKLEKDAQSVRNMVARIAPEDIWEVVEV
jgi:hypothetical protein